MGRAVAIVLCVVGNSMTGAARVKAIEEQQKTLPSTAPARQTSRVFNHSVAGSWDFHDPDGVFFEADDDLIGLAVPGDPEEGDAGREFPGV